MLHFKVYLAQLNKILKTFESNSLEAEFWYTFSLQFTQNNTLKTDKYLTYVIR